jgi:hypothetical protein
MYNRHGSSFIITSIRIAMKLIEVASVCIRVAGLMMLVLVLRDTPQWINSIKSVGEGYGAYGASDKQYIYYLMWFAMIAFSLLMVKFPMTISRILVTRSEADSPLIEENGEAIQIAGFTILGVYILTWAIPDFIHNAMYLWQIKKYAPNDQSSYSATIINELVTVVEIFLALYLTIGAKGLVNSIRKLRE